MIHIFHGDNLKDSRTALNNFLDQNKNADVLKLDQKEIDLDKINNFLNGPSLFIGNKILVLNNFFSITKSTLDKLIKIIKTVQDSQILIWQDKTLNATQIKTFPSAKIENFKLDNNLFKCLNSLKPKNTKNFIPLLHLIIADGLYDLFLYFVKNNIRKQLSGSYSAFKKEQLKKAYLQLIELDYQNKSGQLTIQKEIALERILFNLMEC